MTAAGSLISSCLAFRLSVAERPAVKIIEEVKLLHEQARLLVAGDFLRAIDQYLAKGEHHERKEVKKAVALLSGELKTSFDELRRRAGECRETLTDWDAADWVMGQTLMGITTSYKYGPDGSLWIKMQGTMDDVRVMDQMATVREVDLFHKWVPFCDKSTLLKRLGVVELLVYFSTSVPGACRDCVLHAYGCDSVLEDSCILIQGQSVDRWEGVDIPDPKGWRHARMDVRAFRAKIEVLSPTSASTSIVANIDPKAPLPRSMVNFLVRKVAGMFLYCLKQAARRINGDERNEHRQRILGDKFYEHWLYPRFERFYGQRGWAFDGGILEGRNTSRKSTDSGHELSGASQIKEKTSGRSCVPRGLTTALRRKRSLRAKSERAEGPGKTADIRPPKVENLDIDPRLLQKWRTSKATPRRGTSRSSFRLFFSLWAAACAAFARWLFLEDGKEAFRFRALFALVLFAASVFISTGLI